MLNFSVGALIAKSQGAKENFSVDEPVNFENEGDPKLTDNVVFTVQFLKLPREINVQIKNLKTQAQCVCSRCLKKFLCNIEVPFAEREFIIDLPVADIEEGEDVRYVNKETNRIDLTDMVREEILLHFSLVPVCSDSCKGLCDKCGINLNEKTCLCEHDDKKKISPFRFLTR
ncbi:DUF177 domain-containing protein [Candidatus Peregrinibacteria bacterium]|nr:DUF177 domain-containing protein [Candidatus Peregrinibacteria bacterium]